jgi:hypothetical protein
MVASLHADIFTEPANVDPDTLANLGPLRRLAGTWQARKGIDINPKADGPERRVFIEHNRLDPIDPQTNGPQLLYGLRYHLHINTAEEDITFHDQTGYWLWEPATGLVMQTLSIPRGQVVIAAGKAGANADTFSVVAERGQTEYGICSTGFLETAFRTDRYQIDIEYLPDGRWKYRTHTILMVEGRPEPFDHHDENTMALVAPPQPNPLARILASRASAGKPA